MKSRGRENRCSVSSELPRKFLLCFFGWLQTHLCPELFQTSTFIRSLYHLVLAGSHPLRSHHVGNLIICQHQTYIRAGICSCSLFLQMIGALPFMLTFWSYQEQNHSLLNIVSFSFSCEPNLSSHLWASHMCAKHINVFIFEDLFGLCLRSGHHIARSPCCRSRVSTSCPHLQPKQVIFWPPKQSDFFFRSTAPSQ